MSYLVLARKWRPQSFEDIVGQEHVTKTLKNAIESQRVAHAYLFTGARGVGKTSAARILAKALNCERGPTSEPCGSCGPCKEISAGTSVDVHEIDGASNTGVDDVRELKESINYLPSACRKKIYIIDEVHMLSTPAFNALLKTLEEPPAHVVFIFATTEPHKIPGTILSRCQRFDFKRIPIRLISERLEAIIKDEGIRISKRGIMTIAREADGGMRDAQSLLDQVISFAGSEVSDENITDVLGVIDRTLIHETVKAVMESDCKKCLDIVERLFVYGWDIKEFGKELLLYFRNLAVVKVTGGSHELIESTADEIESMKSMVDNVRSESLYLYFDVMTRGMEDVLSSLHPKISLEMLLLKMADIESLDNIGDLIASLNNPDGDGKRVVPGKEPARYHQKNILAESPREDYQEQEVSEKKGGDWQGFVAFVKKKNIRLGSILEHAHLESFEAGNIAIAFADSFSLSRIEDGDTPDIVEGYSQEYFGDRKSFHFRPLAGEVESINSVHEEKKREESDKSKRLKREALEHPMVRESLDIFGGKIEEIKTEINFNE